MWTLINLFYRAYCRARLSEMRKFNLGASRPDDTGGIAGRRAPPSSRNNHLSQRLRGRTSK